MTDPTKQYTIIFSERPEYLYVDLKGAEISPEIIRGYITEVVARSNETGHRKILLYRDIPAILSAGEVFGTVNESLKALTGKKVALVNPHSEIQKEVQFGVTVGQNRGGNYRSFSNVADAEAWLLGARTVGSD